MALVAVRSKIDSAFNIAVPAIRGKGIAASIREILCHDHIMIQEMEADRAIKGGILGLMISHLVVALTTVDGDSVERSRSPNSVVRLWDIKT